MLPPTQLRAVFDAVPDALVILDNEATILDTNEAVTALAKCTPADLVGRPLTYLIRNDQVVAEMRSAMAAGRPAEILLQDGSSVACERCIQLSLSPEFLPGRHLVLLRDVTGQKRAEERLRFQAQLLDSVGESVAAMDLKGRLTFWGKGAEALYGYTAEEALGQPTRLMVAAGEAEAQKKRMASALEQGSWRGETVQQRRDGSTFHALTSIFVVRDETGAPTGLIGIDRDLTEQKRATALLERRDATLQAVSYAAERFLRGGDWRDCIEDVLASLGEASAVSRVYIFENHDRGSRSPRASLRFGWTAPGFEPRQPLATLAKLSYRAAGFSHWIEPLRAGQSLQSLTEEQPEPARSLLQAHGIRGFLVVPLFVGGRWWGFMGFDDCWQARRWPPALVQALRAAAGILGAAITRDQAEVRVREAVGRAEARSRQLQHVMDAMPAGVILLDAERRVLLTNPIGRDYLQELFTVGNGETLERIGGRPIDDLPMQTAADMPWHELQPPGSSRVYAVAERAAPVGGTDSGRVLVIRDITEERQRQRYLETQSRLATVGQLAAGIAHDFNNILSVITLHSELLEMKPETVPQGRYLRTIRDQARNAAGLITQILDFSRKGVMEPIQLSLVSFLKENVQLLQRTLPDSIDMQTAIEVRELTIEADPGRLQQVLMNLAVNARDAMPEGGVLRIGLQVLHLSGAETPPLPTLEPGSWACLTVGDGGQGIASEHLSRIFEPFFTTKAVGQGSGLGLAQVYGIVRQHGGQIDVSSVPGEGTTFTVYLPALPEAVAELPATAELAPPPGQETILLVEDNGATREAMANVLEHFGYSLLVAGDGREGLDCFRRQPGLIDVLVTDVVMPGLNGVDLARTVLEERPDLPLVLVSGYPFLEEERTGLKRPNVVMLPKPFQIQELVSTIQELLGLRLTLP